MWAIVKVFVLLINVPTAITKLLLRRFPMRYSMMLLVLSTILLTSQQASAKAKKFYGNCTAAQLQTPEAGKCLEDGQKAVAQGGSMSWVVCWAGKVQQCCWNVEGGTACVDVKKANVPPGGVKPPVSGSVIQSVPPGGINPLVVPAPPAKQ